ncbi:BTB/POZ domain-containing protein [Haematococcus lacustris]
MRAEDAENDAGCSSMTFTLDAAASALAVAELWKAGSLVDCVIMSQVDGHRIPAHRLVLAAASRYFCAVFLGAGAHMKEGGQLVDGATSSQLVLVPMPVPGAELELVMRAIYGLELKVDAGNLEVLLHLASYLGLPLVQEACCTFMRTALSLATAVPLLVLAARSPSSVPDSPVWPPPPQTWFLPLPPLQPPHSPPSTPRLPPATAAAGTATAAAHALQAKRPTQGLSQGS